MEKAYARYDGDTRFFKVTMVLEDKKGNKRTRHLLIKSKDYGELIKSYLEFTGPASIKGTTFLSWENEGKDDTQYLYLPALGKSRRVVSSKKKMRFVNTDYTYEDMQRRHPDKDKHSSLGQDYYNGYDCFIIESIPNSDNSQYSKRISWIDKNNFVIIRVNFFGIRRNKTKEFRVLELEIYDNIWTATKTAMLDLKESTVTYMTTEEVAYDGGIDDATFTLNNISKN